MTCCLPSLKKKTEIRIDSSGTYYEIGSGEREGEGSSTKLAKAQINLNDCLACRYVSFLFFHSSVHMDTEGNFEVDA